LRWRTVPKEPDVKKHLRTATAAFAALSLALVACEADDDGLD
jgi:hypothetical protein